MRTVALDGRYSSGGMTAVALLSGLMSAIDDHRWAELSDFLHEDFSCRYVHTGESFDRDAWIRANVEYPGFEHLHVQEIVGDADRAACCSHVTGQGSDGLDHFACATFVRAQDGLIVEMTEVWTDVSQTAPVGTRPDWTSPE